MLMLLLMFDVDVVDDVDDVDIITHSMDVIGS